MTITERKVDLTAKRLFFELLHHARRLKNDLLYNRSARQLYLYGMTCVFKFFHEDFRIADNMRGYWKHQEGGGI